VSAAACSWAPRGGKVSCRLREPGRRPPRRIAPINCPLQTGLKLDPGGERGNVGKLAQLDQRIRCEVQRRWDCECCAVLGADFDNRAQIWFPRPPAHRGGTG